MKIRTPRKKVMFNMSERELCGECGFPEGFCKHTINEEYKELCPDTPLSQESVWQLVRSYAICRTEKRNMFNRMHHKEQELKKENNKLIRENEELKHFRKQMKGLLAEVRTKKGKSGFIRI